MAATAGGGKNNERVNISIDYRGGWIERRTRIGTHKRQRKSGGGASAAGRAGSERGSINQKTRDLCLSHGAHLHTHRAHTSSVIVMFTAAALHIASTRARIALLRCCAPHTTPASFRTYRTLLHALCCILLFARRPSPLSPSSAPAICCLRCALPALSPRTDVWRGIDRATAGSAYRRMNNN